MYAGLPSDADISAIPKGGYAGLPPDADYGDITAQGTPIGVQGDLSASESKRKKMLADFIRSQGTAETRFKEMPASEIVREGVRLPADILKSIPAYGKKIVSGYHGLATLAKTGDLQQAADVVNSYKPQQEENPTVLPSMTSEAVGNLAGAASRGLGRLTGSPELGQGIVEGVTDIAPLVGLARSPIAKMTIPEVASSLKGAAQTITDPVLRGIGKVPGMTDTELYRSALKPGSSMSAKGRANRALATEEGLNSGVVITGDKSTLFGKSINDFTNNLFGDTGSIAKSEDILNTGAEQTPRLSLDSLRNKLNDLPAEAGAGERSAVKTAVEQVWNDLTEHPEYNPSDNTIPTKVAHAEKKKLYETLRRSDAFSKDSNSNKAWVQQEAASGLRQAAVDAIPELADSMGKEGSELALWKYAERRAEQLAQANIGGLTGIIGMLHPRALILKVIDSPGFKSRLGIAIRNANKRAGGVPIPVEKAVAAITERIKTTYDPSTGRMIPAEGQGVTTGGAVENIPQAPGYNPVDRTVQPDVAPPEYRPVDRAVQPTPQPAPYAPVSRTVQPDQSVPQRVIATPNNGYGLASALSKVKVIGGKKYLENTNGTLTPIKE